MDKPECSICDNTFDSDDHRPRVLPCGHGFCSICIEAAIQRGDKSCAICRKEHGANSSNDLPVCFILEDFAHKLAISASQKHVSDLVQESNYGMCPKHKEIPLYFHCKTHSIKVCHSCVVIDHPPASCQLISFEDELKERKYSQIEGFKNQNKNIINTEKELNILLQKNIDQLGMLVTKIEQMNKESLQIKDAIYVCQEKQKSFMLMENKLSAATSNQDIAIQCEKGKTEVLRSQDWEETLKKELNIEQLYAVVERNGVLRTCRVFEENGRVLIPCMSKEVMPPSSARIIKEEELGLNSSTTTVFMDISERGQSKGRVFIRAFGDTCHWQYFIKLVLGIDGFSVKGTNFKKDNVHRINMEDYMTEDGAKKKISFTSPITYSDKQVPSKGMLYLYGCDLSIWINNQARGKATPFASIVSGLNVITTLHASSKFGMTGIIITDCGIVLDS